MIKIPEVLKSRVAHVGWLKVEVDTLKFSDSEELYDYDKVVINAGVAVLPFLDSNTLLLEKQYRHPVSEILLELVQGGISKNDKSLEISANRELEEETGYNGDMEYLFTFYPMPGSLDMRLHVMRAINLRKVKNAKLDKNERLEVVQMPFKNVLSEIMNGNICDSALREAVLFHFAQNVIK